VAETDKPGTEVVLPVLEERVVVGTRPVWWVAAQLIRAHPGYFALCLFFATLYFGMPLAAGLVTRAFFDVLSGSAPAGLDVLTVIALFIAVEVVNVVVGTGLDLGWGSYIPASAALLRRNLLRELLVAHGSRGLIDAPGEAMSRFRDDADGIAEDMDGLIDLIGRFFFAAAALIVMYRIDPAITLLVFVPLGILVAVVDRLGDRTAGLRRASREAVGQVTGFLGASTSADDDSDSPRYRGYEVPGTFHHWHLNPNAVGQGPTDADHDAGQCSHGKMVTAIHGCNCYAYRVNQEHPAKNLAFRETPEQAPCGRKRGRHVRARKHARMNACAR